MDNNIIIPKVSIIMPAYNAELFISDAIKSVVNQVYTDWELIIVDDGSTDTTAEKVQYWLQKDNRIEYYYQENGKQGKARNLGISKSKSEYLAFLDADDLWLPQKLSIQVRQIEEKNVDLVFSDSYFFYNNQTANLTKKMNIKDDIFYDQKNVLSFLENNKIPILTVLVKKEKVFEVGGFSDKLTIQNVEDYHLWLKLLMSGSVFYSSNIILAKYRIHDNSVTSSDKLVLVKILDAFFDLRLLYPNYKNQIEQELKTRFKHIYKTNLFSKEELFTWINKNTLYLSKSKLRYVYLFLNFLFSTKITKRLLIYLLND